MELIQTTHTNIRGGIMGIKYFDLWIWDSKLKEYKSQRYSGWKDVDSLNISNNVDRCEIFVGKEE